MQRRQPTQPGNDSCRKRPRNKSLTPDDSSFTSTATDEEVEQFFAILRQMHAARMMATAAAGKGASNGSTADRSKPLPQEEKESSPDDWRPVFRLEDFVANQKAAPAKKIGSDEENNSTSTGRRESREKHRLIHGRGVALDLNADPEPDGSVPVSV